MFIFFHVQDFFRLLLFLVLSGFPYFFALCLLLSLLFPPLCCTCWHLMSNMKIGTTAGKYSMCIILGPFHKGTRAKRKSATNPPQWVHIPLLCFFCLVCFLSLLLFLCCRIYPVGSILAWIEYFWFLLHVYFLSFSRFMFLVSLPCPSCSPSLFCVCSRGTEHMTLGTLAGTYSMCIVSGPFQEGTITKKKAPAISVNSYYAPLGFRV